MRLNKKSADIFFMLAYPIIGIFLSFNFDINAFWSAFVFFGLPAAHLCFRIPQCIKKSLLFSLFSVPMMIVIDYIAEKTETWVWPLPHSIIDFKFFGHVSIEVLVWAYLNFFVVIMFYEYFFEKRHIKRLWYPVTNQFLYWQIGIFSIFLILLFTSSNLLHIPYWYLVFGLIFLLPPIILEEIRFRTVFLKLLKASVYFFYLNLIYEVVALKIGWWAFPSSQFLGLIPVGGVKIPFEEFFFWIILFTLTVLSYYEYFDNNEK